MLDLKDRDAVTAALTDPALDAELRALIGLRVWQVDENRRHPLQDILQIVVVHASYQSTQRYSHLANDTLLKAVEAGAAKQAAF